MKTFHIVFFKTTVSIFVFDKTLTWWIKSAFPFIHKKLYVEYTARKLSIINLIYTFPLQKIINVHIDSSSFNKNTLMWNK